jgi:hypothetical protein
MNERPRARRVAYAVAVLATVLSMLLHLSLLGFAGPQSPFVTFFPAIVLGADLGGWRPGLVATLLGAAAHKRSGMVVAFSGVAGGVASEREDHAAQGRLEESRPGAARLETMAEELLRRVGGLSLDALREQAGAAGSPDRAAGP